MSALSNAAGLLKAFVEMSEAGAWDDVEALASQLENSLEELRQYQLNPTDRPVALAVNAQIELALAQSRERLSQIGPLLESLAKKKC